MPDIVQQSLHVIDEPFKVTGKYRRTLTELAHHSPYRYWEVRGEYPAPDGKLGIWYRKHVYRWGGYIRAMYALAWTTGDDAGGRVDLLYESTPGRDYRSATAWMRLMADYLREEMAPGVSRLTWERENDPMRSKWLARARGYKEQRERLMGGEFREHAEALLKLLYDALPPEAAGRTYEEDENVQGVIITPRLIANIHIVPTRVPHAPD